MESFLTPVLATVLFSSLGKTNSSSPQSYSQIHYIVELGLWPENRWFQVLSPPLMNCPFLSKFTYLLNPHLPMCELKMMDSACLTRSVWGCRQRRRARIEGRLKIFQALFFQVLHKYSLIHRLIPWGGYHNYVHVTEEEAEEYVSQSHTSIRAEIWTQTFGPQRSHCFAPMLYWLSLSLKRLGTCSGRYNPGIKISQLFREPGFFSGAWCPAYSLVLQFWKFHLTSMTL